LGYYAAFLDLGDRRCLVVGGGDAAEEKARGLLEAGAGVSVAWDTFNTGFEQLAQDGRLELLRHRFEEADLEGCAVVVDASGDEATGALVSAAARARGVLVNVLDRPELCDFIAPALVRRGPLQLAISTAGRSPFMASHLRRLLEDQIGPEWGELVDLVGMLRDRLRAEEVPLAEQMRIYDRIPGSGALELLRQGRREEARLALEACAGTATRS
jgi:siroheme synthase-like protein